MSFGVTMPIRVLLVDHQAIFRVALRTLIETWPRFSVVGEAGNPVDALEITAREQPAIILLDLDLGSAGNGLDCIPDLLSTSGEGRIIILTGVRDAEAYHRAMHLGAMGLVLKEQTPEELRRAILKVHAGELWVDRKLATSIITRISRPSQTDNTEDIDLGKIASLTEREREVIDLVCEGLKNKEIADRLFISLTTVRHHLTSIFAKLQVASRFELIIFAYRHKLVNLLQVGTVSPGQTPPKTY
jgi:two-component system, NarL family, nitrate/nitrite response regulator NarL